MLVHERPRNFSRKQAWKPLWCEQAHHPSIHATDGGLGHVVLCTQPSEQAVPVTCACSRRHIAPFLNLIPTVHCKVCEHMPIVHDQANHHDGGLAVFCIRQCNALCSTPSIMSGRSGTEPQACRMPVCSMLLASFK